MINLVLFYCERMQGFFGLGAHIEELVNYFKKQANIHITIVFTESEKYAECTFIQEDEIDMLHIPSPENGLFLSVEDSLVMKTLALRILQVAYPYLKEKENIVCWFNSLAEFNIVKQIKDLLPCKILYVHHGWLWKDYTKVENDVFAREWKNSNAHFCPQAFEYTTYQLEMVAHSDCTITVTQQANNYFQSAFDVPEHKLRTIYNGINPPSINHLKKRSVKRELGLYDNEQIILFTGRVVGNKGIFFLIDAFKQLLKRKSDCRLVLIGTGTLGEVLRAAMPVWSKITLTDFIGREWMQKWYAVADVGILPSLMEQCSYTAIEMRFWKIPLIISAVDGLDEMFEHEEDCLKLPVHYDEKGERTLNYLEIAQNLYRLLTEPALCYRLTQNGYQKAIEKFTIERMGSEYMQVIETMKEPCSRLLP
jgi:glycosyltransferase involved in cell wall biosynthesis